MEMMGDFVQFENLSKKILESAFSNLISFRKEDGKKKSKKDLETDKEKFDLIKVNFVHHGFIYHLHYGDGIDMLNILSDSHRKNVYDFDSNFKGNLMDINPDLSNNKTWKDLIFTLIQTVKWKGVGSGEIVLPILIPGWEFLSTGSDGRFLSKEREVKDGLFGGGIKAVLSDDHKDKGGKGLIDDLNKKYWGGFPKRNKLGFLLSEIKKNPEKALEYYNELWGMRWDCSQLVNDIIKVDSVSEFEQIVGVYHLKWYKEMEGFGSLIVLNKKSLSLINIANPNKGIYNMGISVTQRMSRGGDSYAVPDGFTVIKSK